MEFIDLISPALDFPSGCHQEERRHSLGVSDWTPGLLRAVGVIPHGANFRPADAKSRDRLVELLRSIDYDGEKCPGAPRYRATVRVWRSTGIESMTFDSRDLVRASKWVSAQFHGKHGGAHVEAQLYDHDERRVIDWGHHA